MRKTAATALAALATLGMTASVPAEECVNCNWEQQCEIWDPNGFLPPGEECTIFAHGGQMWCNWESVDPGSCDGQEELAAVNLTAAGTYATATSFDRNGLGTIPCSGFVVGHAPSGSNARPLVIAL